ncbi:MAG: antitoxin [Candidatus Aminicenantes bacterium]|nr:antitoxin [Candidatus Aminicenantes bacterium]NIM83498.1 antitoxin [Candidatus Aminicenantes bacterium]NIN22887.1 antitoxin [Candidatus Aminicenantes bacterium]NIN46626.1 antitoxin [Candidatus Aminicenantes bacterium]NIN89529.1 antitoxin [Candidatus Aminicenantes bacterium]
MNHNLDEEEKDILDSFEKGEWKEVPKMDEEIKRHIEYAKATHRKDKRINIRISERDLELIQRKALEEGVPYQTLISSLIHKYINGRLVDKEVLISSEKDVTLQQSAGV